MTQLSLHPFDAPPKAMAIFNRLARQLARPVRGAVHDPQTDTSHCPPGKRRFVPAPKQTLVDAIAMSWWFEERAFPGADGFAGLLDILETLLPEALPRRYGTIEPAQFRYETGGRAAFERFLHGNAHDYFLWHPNPPVFDVDLALAETWGSFRDGFRSHHLSITVDAALLAQPGWERQLRRLWRRVSLLLQPFYGDVRTIRGYRRAGGRTEWHPVTTENHPVQRFFWAGLPPGLGHAAVVGEPYESLWPALADAAEHEGGLAFLDAPSWRAAGAAPALTLPVPPELADPLPQGLHKRHVVLRLDRPYPKVWPFEAPFAARS